MTEPDGSSGLRAARVTRGWSQSQAARELTALARARGSPVASTASLKTLLSRWENGHSAPDAAYRSLLADLYGRTPTELGLVPATEPGGGPTADLVTALAGAAIGGDAGTHLWRRQLDLAHELDDQLGAAGAGELVEALVERLGETLLHTVPRSARVALAGLLVDAATLAGTQALDRAHHDRAWRRFDQARTAALVGGRTAAGAAAGQAAVLVDLGRPSTAIELLEQVHPVPEGPAQARLHAALAVAAAAGGESQASRRAIAAAERRLRLAPHDLLDHGERPAVELADLHRWQGRVLVTLGDPDAPEPLRQALDAGPRSARHRAEVHADLALALHAGRPQEAAAHARTARRLATGIGSARITARLSALGNPG
jgi:transcriptional regulator with XRE-family HTH domain